MNGDFEQWISTFRASIAPYDYYVNFNKAAENKDKIKRKLCLLNSLIGSHKIEEEFKLLLGEYPEVLSVIPILLGVRSMQIDADDPHCGAMQYHFDHMNYSVEQYCVFMRETGLFDMISQHILNNLVDYVFGVEVGLDSNGRKNRGGHLMEALVQKIIEEAGFVCGSSYFMELNRTSMEKMWNVDLSVLSVSGEAEKRFDFVVRTKSMIYAIETNFYQSAGSKLNETSKSYQLLFERTQTLDNFRFIWITDGQGWLKAKSNLRDAYEKLSDLYNIKDLENGVLKEVLR